MLADVAEPLADGEESDSDEDITTTKGRNSSKYDIQIVFELMANYSC